MRYCFDIDGTICTQEPDNTIPYNKAAPYKERIARINELYEQGNQITLFSARGTVTGIDWKSFTEKQLMNWGVKYHELIFGKPEADFFIDDKGMTIEEFISTYNSSH